MAWRPLRNVGLKAAALALGTLLWLTVSGHQVERRVRVPLSYSNMPSNLEMTSEQDDVSVHVRGSDSEVSRLGAGDLRVIVDLTDAHAGANLLVLRVDQVEALLGIEVLRIEPSSVSVTLEKSASKAVPVEITLDGQPADGFAVGDVSVDPATIVVVGPESRLSRPASVRTERIRIDGLRANLVQEVSVVSVDSALRLPAPRRVRVVVQIRPERGAP